jgi:methionyl-tRNA formyltransferase
METYRTVFMSSSNFGIPAFESLLAQPWCEMAALVTQPDKPAGRGQKMTSLPIKELALARDIPVIQPPNLRTTDAIHQVGEAAPDLIIVAAYGQWIPAEIYDTPPHRSLNIHPSLLPRHRGAAPAMSAILSGDEETGVSILFVVDEMDAGDLLAQSSMPILPEDTTASLMRKLAVLGAELMADVAVRWLRGQIHPVPQDHSQATWFGRIKKDQGCIDWTQSAEHIWRQVRAFSPWPSAYTTYGGKRLVIHSAEPVDVQGSTSIPAGLVVVLPQGTAVATDQGALLLREVQIEGKRSVPIAEFLTGQRDFIGSRLG